MKILPILKGKKSFQVLLKNSRTITKHQNPKTLGYLKKTSQPIKTTLPMKSTTQKPNFFGDT